MASPCLALGAVMLASCASAAVVSDRTSSPRPTGVAPSTPAGASVADGRFVRPVQLDDGTLQVEPPGPGAHPTLSEAKAAAEIWASPTLAGYRSGPVGFGIVTIGLHPAGVPPVRALAAWIGIAVANPTGCPEETVPTGPTTTQPVLPSSGYAAVVLGAATGSPAVAYVARTSTCGSSPTGPTVTAARKVVSIPWVPLGTVTAGRLTVRATVPPCGTYRGASSSGTVASLTLTLAADVPDVPHGCGGVRTVTESVQIGLPAVPVLSPQSPPPASAGTKIDHGPLGVMRTTDAVGGPGPSGSRAPSSAGATGVDNQASFPVARSADPSTATMDKWTMDK
jgi:hypothetical protein